MSSVSPTNQDLSNDTTFSQIKSHASVPLSQMIHYEQAFSKYPRFLK